MTGINWEEHEKKGTVQLSNCISSLLFSCWHFSAFVAALPDSLSRAKPQKIYNSSILLGLSVSSKAKKWGVYSGG